MLEAAVHTQLEQARARAWRGVAWRGMAWRGVAWRGVACELVGSWRFGLLWTGSVAAAASVSNGQTGGTACQLREPFVVLYLHARVHSRCSAFSWLRFVGDCALGLCQPIDGTTCQSASRLQEKPRSNERGSTSGDAVGADGAAATMIGRPSLRE